MRMTSALESVEGMDTLLRRFARPAAGLDVRTALKIIACVSPLYGLAMGSFEPGGERFLYACFAAIKMPLMILGTSAVCLPGYIVLSTVLGLGNDSRPALRAILGSQAAFAAAVASLAPLTLFVYVCGADYREALVVNGAMFLCATAAAQCVLWRQYGELLAASRRHALMLCYWMVAYVLVGIEMGWMLRPFIGTPGVSPSFFRAEPFSNAYVVVWGLVGGR